MIFTKRGFLGTKTIENLYILSQLKKQTFDHRELLNIDRQIREASSMEEDVFIKAKQIKSLKKKKQLTKRKYLELREECNRRIKKLEKTITWKMFYISYSIANFIFQGYSYPMPLREIISNHSLRDGNIYSNIGLEIFDNDPFYSKSNLFDSKKLCSAFLSGGEINLKFISKLRNFDIESVSKLNNKLSKTYNSKPKSSSLAYDYIESPIDLNKYLIKNGAATFLVRAAGQSMLGSGITDQAVLVVDRSIKAKHDDIVVASIDGEFVCKRLKLKPKMCLMPDNPESPTIFIKEGQELEIVGTVTSAINRFN